jgi:2-polyprenyl-3-methyl-5-hydroxy-6-metoxy-1,4-benzoquinol methylase
MEDVFSRKQIARSYGSSRWVRGYVGGKLALDPVFRVARRIIARRNRAVVDLGCGLGILGICLRTSGITLKYKGTDPEPWKINSAKQAMRYFGFEEVGYEVVDALSTEIPQGATVCLFDVLHYLDKADQERMTTRLADAARSGSLILIRTALRSAGWRYWMTLLEEKWTRLSGWIRGGKINFPSREEITASFSRHGLNPQIIPLWGKTPFASHLIVISPPGEPVLRL